jgi:hypothetical protein
MDHIELCDSCRSDQEPKHQGQEMDSVLHADWNLEQDRAMKFLGLDAADGSIVAFVLHCTEETDSVF